MIRWFALKYDQDSAARYRAEGLPIHQIDVEFSREQRKVVGFTVETLAAG